MESTPVVSSDDVKLVDLAIFAPHVREQVETLLMEGNLALSHRVVEVMNPRPSFTHNEGEDYDCDRFQLIIPYAGTPLECMVVFQSTGPECPPDFVFSDPRFFVPINEIESLSAWDVKNSSALSSTVKEIIQVYKKKQIQELEKYYYLSFEYLCLYQLKEFEEDDIEIIVPPEPDSPVHFLIRLHVDLHSYFSEFYDEGYEIEENPLLLVTYPDRSCNKSIQRLYLTRNMETLLGLDDTFQLSLEITDNYLTRYMVAIQEELKTRCELSASRYQKRKLYFLQFLAYFSKSIVEYDIMFYSCIVLLLKEGNFHFMVEINLPDNYPNGTPALIFRSIYHKSDNKPVQIAVDSYPYSSKWSITRVLQETVKFMAEYAPRFMQNSTPGSSKY